MRLLHIQDGGFSLVEFIGQDIPPYAILSHTWGADDQEVTYQDMIQGTGRGKIGRGKLGFDKLRACARQAAADGLAYFWVDTCCSAELTESINSMFQWYKSADVCYAFLEDLVPGHAPGDSIQHCRWFSRGWTLQELIAPRIVKFFNKNWDFIGNKADYARVISHSTNIHESVLLGSQELSSFSIARKMAWAAGRRTKRLEDTAYCLLGIFDVNMPLIYGEGERAFRRLQEEIVRRDNDLTILLWRCLQDSHERFIGCFAPSPANFAGRHAVVPFPDVFAEFSTTNKGLFLSTGLSLETVEIQYTGETPSRVYWMALGRDPNMNQGIYLHKLAPHFYCRLAEDNMKILTRPEGRYRISNVHIVTDSRVSKSNVSASYRRFALRVQPSKTLKVKTAFPTAYWDHTDSMFLTGRQYKGIHDFALLLHLQVLVGTEQISVKLLCRQRSRSLGYDLGILEDGGPFHQSHLIYASRYQESGVPWDIIGYDETMKWPLRNEVTVKTGDGVFRLVFTSELDGLTSWCGYISTRILVVSATRLEESGQQAQKSPRSMHIEKRLWYRILEEEQ